MLIETSKKNAICFDNSYVLLGSRFYASVKPTPVERPCIVKLNYGLARDLGIDLEVIGAGGIGRDFLRQSNPAWR